MTYSLAYIDNFTLDVNRPSCDTFAQSRLRQIVDVHSDELLRATGVVRRHAIETGDIASIRLVRLLKDAISPNDVELAIAAFDKWTAAVALATTQACVDVPA